MDSLESIFTQEQGTSVKSKEEDVYTKNVLSVTTIFPILFQTESFMALRFFNRQQMEHLLAMYATDNTDMGLNRYATKQ